ncbi:MAG: N-6 DNA methylase [Deltaproteobacteria bacterium]|nr:N-6 DNA methylase [Deltaproteobacteria bacterium]
MVNERKTEAIVREHFGNFSDQIYIEEQRSDNPKIDKLLKNASKKGEGKGYPEFIISYKTNSDLLIVVECKASITKHESKTCDKYSEFAVDGVLLYTSYLSKNFDVLAIAVSGETKQSLKVSHFLHLKNAKKAFPIFGNKFLSVKDYLKGYLKTPEKFSQDYNTLLSFTKELNGKLHKRRILESQRSLLISSILIALENKAFKISYASHKKPYDLAVSLIQTVSSELERANITGKKLDNLNTQFSFIKTDTSLSKEKNVLKEFIDDIDENINIFIKTHRYFDVLGQLYVEFLRYANSDKGLGIVLTPPHITDLFADLAQVNKNSIAYDNCMGTGGFLISAMKKMISDAKGDNIKIKAIKKKQLIGTEYQAHIFALAVSNMYIHQDGKTNIINGSCFDEKIIKQVKAKRPTVGFLNPPYKSNKKVDREELEFILNNLECLVNGGTCIAIVPMQSALAQKGKVLEFKKRLLQKHTLEAVLSMPNELFYDSNVNVNTCVLVLKAYEKHPKNFKTYFGYWKDDGFLKIKNKGRIDYYNKWNSIKEDWLKNFRNKDEIIGISIKKAVSGNNEWSVEAYMKTDYKKFKKNDFIESIHNFVGFQFNMENIQEIKNKSLIINKINLFDKDWKYFKYPDLFNSISRGKRLTKMDRDKGDTLYFSASEFNNGCTDKISNSLFIKKDAIIYTTFGDAYYVKGEFTASDEISIFQSDKLNVFNGIFISTVISKNKYKYYFGRKAFRNKFINDLIPLPIDKNKNPDWNFMETYIKSLPYSSNL